MSMKKIIKAEIKALTETEGQGIIQAYASVFDVKDAYGDVVRKGAFADSLAEDYSPGGAGVPIYWGHDYSDPFKNIGTTLQAIEDDHGLWIEAQLDLETNNGKQTWRLIEAGRVNQLSIGYQTLDWAEGKSDEFGWYVELKKIKLFEISIVPIGANQETEILYTKARAILERAQKGQGLNLAELQSAYDALGAVLAQQTAESENSDGGDAEPQNENDNTEEPEGANVEDQQSEAALVKAKNKLKLIGLGVTE